MKTFEQIMADPTRCNWEACEAENELLLHVTEEPPGYADLCLAHAKALMDSTPLMWVCGCAFCVRGRDELSEHVHADRVVLCDSCTGRWDLTTASGAVYRLDLVERTMTRNPRSAQARSNLAEPSVDLRKDGETVPLHSFEPVRIGQPAVLTISGLDTYAGYSTTLRETTPVVAVEEAR